MYLMKDLCMKFNLVHEIETHQQLKELIPVWHGIGLVQENSVNVRKVGVRSNGTRSISCLSCTSGHIFCISAERADSPTQFSDCQGISALVEKKIMSIPLLAFYDITVIPNALFHPMTLQFCRLMRESLLIRKFSPSLNVHADSFPLTLF